MQLDTHLMRKFHGTLLIMGGTQNGNPAQHFGKQMRKERLARGWSLPELSARTGINAGHLSRIETGKRPPTENVAMACDAACPERKGYFLEYYEESRTWVPPGFRDWPELENKAARLSVWTPGVMDGLVQSITTTPTLYSPHCPEPPPRPSQAACDHAWTGRSAYSPAKTRQPSAASSTTPRSTAASAHPDHGRPTAPPGRSRQPAPRDHPGPPAIAHPATQSGFMVTDSAAYAEHVIGGFAYTEPETVTALERLFDSLRDECYRVSESLAIIRKAGELWTGGSPVTQVPTAASA